MARADDRVRRDALLIVALLVSAARLSGQLPTNPQAEFRADAYSTRTALVGIGVSKPAGLYARPGATYSIGVNDDAGVVRMAHRVDLNVRFLLDPLRQQQWAPYGSAGAAIEHRNGLWREYLVVRLGFEGPPSHGILPALELGLGGGAHVGVVIRSGRTAGR